MDFVLLVFIAMVGSLYVAKIICETIDEIAEEKDAIDIYKNF